MSLSMLKSLRPILPLLSLVSGSGLAACNDPSITVPDGGRPRDLREATDGDPQGGPYRAVDEVPVLMPQVKLDPPHRWREWSRDPSYVVAGAEQHLYFAGSPSTSSGAEQWTIGRARAPLGQPLQTAPAFEQLLPARAGLWDSGDLLSPAALPSFAGAAGGAAIWYAASGDPQRPDYVFQIGYASSSDGQNWMRRGTPVLAAPTFTSPGADGEPTAAGPASHGLLDPAVLPQGGTTVWLYFAGLSCDQGGCRFQILRSVSADGVNFQAPQVVLKGRDGVAEEAGGVAGPSVLNLDGTYYLAYTQVKEPPTRSRLGVRRALLTGSLALAVSQNGTEFTSAIGQRPLLYPNRDFYGGGSGSPSLFEENGALQLFFGAVPDSALASFLVARAKLQR